MALVLTRSILGQVWFDVHRNGRSCVVVLTEKNGMEWSCVLGRMTVKG
jgi:hypothetical protein